MKSSIFRSQIKTVFLNLNDRTFFRLKVTGLSVFSAVSFISLIASSSKAAAGEGTGRSYNCEIREFDMQGVVAKNTVRIENMYHQFAVGNVIAAGWVTELGQTAIHISMPVGNVRPEAFAGATVASSRLETRLANDNRLLASAICTLNPKT